MQIYQYLKTKQQYP